MEQVDHRLLVVRVVVHPQEPGPAQDPPQLMRSQEGSHAIADANRACEVVQVYGRVQLGSGQR